MPKSDMVITPGIILMVLTLAGIVKSQCDTTYTDVLTRVWGYYDVESSNNTLVVGAADSLSVLDELHGNTQRDFVAIGVSNLLHTPGRKPILVASVINGHKVIRFEQDASGTRATEMEMRTSSEMNPSGSGGGEFEVYIVLKDNDDPPATQNTSGLWNFSGNDNQDTHWPFTDGTVYESFGTITNGRVTVGNPSPSLSSAFRLYNVVADTNSHLVRLDTTVISDPVKTYNPSFARACLGSSLNYTLRRFSGDIAFFRLYRPKLSQASRDSLQNYLSWKYDLAGFNPSNTGRAVSCTSGSPRRRLQ